MNSLAKTLAAVHAFLHEAEKLKTLLRHSWLSSGRQESVAEHSWRLALMAIVLSPYIKQKLNMSTVLQMCIVHDLAEALTGDEVWFLSQSDDKVDKEEKALQHMIKSLEPQLQTKLMSIWREYEERATLEAKFVYSLDKLEVLIQHNEADLKTWIADEFEINYTYAYDKVDWNDTLLLLRDLILEETIEKIEDEPTI